mgnify:CR=1 FL=1
MPSANISIIIFLFTPSGLFAAETLLPLSHNMKLGAFGTAFILFTIVFIMIVRNNRQYRSYKKAILKVKEEAIEAERAKDTFLANVSHETRTPMNAIIGLSHILLQSDLSHAQRTNVAKIKRSAEHLLSITNDILDFSKIEAGKLEINTIDFKSSDFFSNLADMLSVNAVEKKLDLIFDISKDVPDTLVGDPLRISQVLINLLNNAIKYSGDSRHISVRLFQNQTSVVTEVEDEGIGIAKEDLPKIFDEFFRAGNHGSGNITGTGLGLTVVKEIVESHHGSIKAESEIGKGSKFSVILYH